MKKNGRRRLLTGLMSRRRLLGTGGAFALSALSMPATVGSSKASQEKPKELKVRSWGGIWEESLRRGVSDPFSETTGIAVRQGYLQPKDDCAADPVGCNHIDERTQAVIARNIVFANGSDAAPEDSRGAIAVDGVGLPTSRC